ncbi:DUF317 domain-containing protein [Streptomyces hawaiiensis]|uniref:DUF317 domain-containing protein n=1 Tax=Streptomyces hawaiiensis TaxID=67305 RepID=UPI0036598987
MASSSSRVTLRIERVHETPAQETTRTVVAYETLVSDRTWVLTATGSTPAPVLHGLLDHFADGDGWDTAIGTPVDDGGMRLREQPSADRRGLRGKRRRHRGLSVLRPSAGSSPIPASGTVRPGAVRRAAGRPGLRRGRRSAR